MFRKDVTLVDSVVTFPDDAGLASSPAGESGTLKEHDIPESTHEQFFRDMLGDVTEPTLPFGLAEVRLDANGMNEAHQRLPASLNARLRTQARRLGVSVATLCHLAWARVLASVSGNGSGQFPVVFGTVLLGRMHAGAGAERALGLYINTLPLRVDIDATGAEDAVRATYARLAQLLHHEHASLALAQRASGVPAPTPLFSALLNYRHHDAADGLASPSLDGVEQLGREERTNYPFTLSVDDDSQSLILTAQVNEPVGAKRVCGYMQQALDSLVHALEHAPSTPLNQLDVLPAEERHLLLHTWNDTVAPFPGHLCVHQLFEQQVERTPEAIALVCEDQSLTYAELNARANRLAHSLIERGVAPDARVALCVERSPAMIVGLMAILKAGGAYVPLDPTYPGERLAHILSDAEPVLLLADATGRAALGNAATACLPSIALDAPPPAHQPVQDPRVVGLTSRHLAYVIYTSGSTGAPKGIAMPHEPLVNLIDWHVGAVCPQPGERTLQFTSLSFDVSFQEIFSAWHSGGTLVMIDEDTRRNCGSLIESIVTKRIHHLFVPYQMLNALAEASSYSGSTLPLINVITAGEQLLVNEPIRRWFERMPACRLHNHYGPSETHVTTAHYVGGPGKSWPMLPPIGKPIASTRLYLLDAVGRPVPLGAVGELYIGGAGVARGYLNRPELTAERFLDDPFSDTPGARLYRTGDLARYLPDGNLEFLGRNDHQVKIRGFRIECGEIEVRLAEHPAVREAIVVAHEDAAGSHANDKRLVAYLLLAPEAATDELAQALRAHLAERLPDYMVPAAFVTVEALPLTPNGKLDRRALPAPDDDAFAHRAYEAPQGKTEITLATLWRELLNVERIGRNDSFFELGGHSLLAVRLVNRIRAIFNVELPIRVLFDAPDIMQLAKLLGERFISVSGDNLIKLRSHGTLTPLFCIHPGYGFAWDYVQLLPHLNPKRPLYAIQARGLEQRETLPSTIEEMAHDYIEQIQCIQPTGPYYLLGWSFGALAAHAIATQLQRRGHDVAFLGLLDGYPPAEMWRHGIDYSRRDDPANQRDSIRLQLHTLGLLGIANQEQVDYIIDVARNNQQLMSQYSPMPFHGDICFVKANLADEDEPSLSPAGWGPYVTGDIHVNSVAASHYEILDPPTASAVGKIINEALSQ